MEYTIENETIQAVICDAGAELISLKKDDVDYLWSGDPAYWKEHAPVLFPFAGRLCDEQYTVHGKPYRMPIHGFAKRPIFSLVEQKTDSLTLGISDTDETREQYPFSFDFQVTYTLYGSSLDIAYEVQNHSDEIMYFGLGGHPGFRVPLEPGLAFEDYYLEFADRCSPDRIGMSDRVLVTGDRREYPLEDGRRIRLHHDLFDQDAIVLANMSDMVTLRSDRGSRSVTLSYPGMPYLGIWHAVKTNAPYVAIEPWMNLPARDGIVEDFAARSDLGRLDVDGYYANVWSIGLQ